MSINEVLHTAINIFKQTSTITVFVLVMMLVLEYITIKTKGNISSKLKTKPWLQIIIAGVMGLIPGCLGTFAVVSMYIHRTIGLPALVTALIATSGDEAFIMFSMIPADALLLMLIIFVIAIITGFIVKIFMKNEKLETHEHIHYHKEKKECLYFEKKTFIKQIKSMIWQRAIILLAGFLFLFMIIFAGDGHVHLQVLNDNNTEVIENHNCNNYDDYHSYHDYRDHYSHEKLHNESHSEKVEFDNNDNEEVSHVEGWGWERVTFLIVTLIGLLLIFTVPDHFLKEHLWGHVISKHFKKIFLWTLAAFVVLNIINSFLDIENWIQENIYIIMLVAVLIGMIPESGPHIIFISLFAGGVIPFSILVANSIVQDGHGSIPLLAESGKSFIIAKVINAIVGLLVGYTLLFTGF